ncbi:hypothetical protein OJAV_G00198860 [Oryzias javanicus]|uniref:Uncharacterized protein n=1 Tax=Oryzias javanicus TaxID=123683 RepID=A0A3S2P6T7_ORYJA|nr:hypothetical protein OJAV_G00198860 [Oryzias javanicus]
MSMAEVASTWIFLDQVCLSLPIKEIDLRAFAMDKEWSPLDCLLPSGTQKICLILLNQPLDKNYLHILWSKGTSLCCLKNRLDKAFLQMYGSKIPFECIGLH